MKAIKLFLQGKPLAMPRPRVSKRGQVYYPKNITECKKICIKHIKEQIEIQHWEQPEKIQPVKVTMEFVHPRVKRLKCNERTFKVTRPDIDNIVKFYLDVCTQSEIWVDDSVVAVLQVSDHYAGVYEEPHTYIKVEVL